MKSEYLLELLELLAAPCADKAFVEASAEEARSEPLLADDEEKKYRYAIRLMNSNVNRPSRERAVGTHRFMDQGYVGVERAEEARAEEAKDAAATAAREAVPDAMDQPGSYSIVKVKEPTPHDGVTILTLHIPRTHPVPGST